FILKLSIINYIFTENYMDLTKLEVNKIYRDDFGSKFGILLLNKPAGITSNDLVNLVREKFKIKRVGHAGALDPFASGLMIVLVGKSVKLSQEMIGLEKEYQFQLILGLTSSTLDVEGKLTMFQNPLKLNFDQI